MKICEYGCGQEAKYQFKNGKWCCSKDWRCCPEKRRESRELKRGKNHPMYGIPRSKETRKKLSKSRKGKVGPNKGKKFSLETRKKLSKSMKGRIPWNKGKKLTIKQIKKRYSFFSQIEEMRYNPDKSKEIQVHCKNHLCPNSKEQGGWFTPTYIQLYERIRAIENTNKDLSYFYCSDNCKIVCPLHPKKSNNEKPYTQEEYQQFREYVLKRDDHECQYCGEKATIVHHERPQKIEPFFSLDPDLAWSCCEKCHYKYGHKTGTECSTGNLANEVC